MIILKFSTHPLTREHLDQIERILNKPAGEVREIVAQISDNLPIVQQAIDLVDSCNLSPDEW